MTPGKYEELAMRSEANHMVIINRLADMDTESLLRLTQLRNGVTGLSDEVGELNSAVKKHVEYGKPLDVVNVKEEIGDCIWRISQICQAIGYSIEQAMIHNIEKLKIRYPDGFTDFHAAEENRDRVAERQLIEEPLNYGLPSFTYQVKDGKPVRTETGLVTCPFCQSVGVGSCTCKARVIVSQTGQGFAELPVELPEAEPIVVATFGDGLVRDQKDSSYNRPCVQCKKVMIHRTNTTNLCPDCFTDIEAGRQTLKR